MLEILQKIAAETKLQSYQVNNVIKLLFQEECTVPFITRYRKEMTGSMDEVAVRAVRDRYAYLTELEDNKQKYLKVVEEFCKKNPAYKDKFPEIKNKILACETKQLLEDIYLPFKPKRRTRAQVAKEKGLEALLEIILQQRTTLQDLASVAMDFVTPADSKIDSSIKVLNIEAALAGASDIYSERMSETPEIRAKVREISFATGMLVSKKIETDDAPKEESKNTKDRKVTAATFQNYFDYKESIHASPAHRIMAVRRGEAEKFLRVNIEVDKVKIVATLEDDLVSGTKTTKEVSAFLKKSIEDSYERLLSPAIETEIRLQLKNRAEDESMKVFTKNLENLLLLPPLPGKVVMGVDPGIRTGSKLAVVNETGALLFSTTVYPDFKQNEILDTVKTKQTKEMINNLINSYKVEYIAIGNGTAGRELDKIVASVIKEKNITGVRRLTVNEAGASVYSTDEIAREEFPDLDPTIRSAISIARRLQDPLAELVKIDPRSIGVGQYQHDVNVTKLKGGLEEVVESCVNRVGVNLNTASYKLLAYVSGIGPSLAKNIVTHRDKQGRFNNRTDITKIPGFGPKAFEQAAGFLRVPESKNPLDNSSVHPERYEIVENIAKTNMTTVADMVGKPQVINAIAWEKFVTDTVGLPTLKDIAAELVKPGRDPREDGERMVLSDDVFDFDDLKPNMALKGTVTNVTNFGAFIDIGVHQDGLIHISELSDEFVKDPSDVVAVGDVLDVRVLEVDKARRRISLTAKKSQGPAKSGATSQKPQQQGQPRNDQRNQSKPKKQEPNFTMNDLLAKFGKK